MSFNSLEFLIFLPITILLFWILPQKIKPYFLLLASLFCYCFSSFYLLFLILAVVLVCYLSAILIEKEEHKKKKKAILIFTIIFVFSLLFIFKYLNFTIKSFYSLYNLFNKDSQKEFHNLNIILPVGISFFTFQAIGYVIDVYRENIKSEKNFFFFTLFITYFPQLVAGPIERSDKLLPQLLQEHHFKKEYLAKASQFLLSGYIKKIIIADFLAILVDEIYSSLSTTSGIIILLSGALFYFQIYADFSGYGDIAIGCSALLGIDIANNFNKPYLATSIKDFYHRWHITLSNWFKDYVYIPLGGNRKGEIRTYINTMIVFLLSGLWHGANFTFIVWGFLSGLCVVIEDIIHNHVKRKNDKILYGYIKIFCTFILTSLLWIIFRCQSISDIILCIKRIFTSFINGTNLDAFNLSNILFLLLAITLLFLLPYLPTINFNIKDKSDNIKTSLVYVVMLFLISFCWLYLSQTQGESGFIYFQF